MTILLVVKVYRGDTHGPSTREMQGPFFVDRIIKKEIPEGEMSSNLNWVLLLGGKCFTAKRYGDHS